MPEQAPSSPTLSRLDAFAHVIQLVFETNGMAGFEIDHKLFAQSPFTCVYNAEKKLAFHCINLNFKDWSVFDQDFFCRMNTDAAKRKIKLIHLWYDVWASDNSLVEQRLLAIAGKSKRIFARNTIVKPVAKTEAAKFLNENHLQKNAAAVFFYGLFYRNELVAVASFSKPRKMTYQKPAFDSYELVRFANKTGVTVTGGLSKLINYFIKETDAKHIMTYADSDWSSGESYLKLGFKYSGNTQPLSFLVDKVGLKRYFNTDSSKINGYNLKTEPWRTENTLLKIYNSGSAKYILDLR